MNRDYKINCRLQSLIDELDITAYELAKRMGLKRADGVYKILNKEVKPSPKTLEKIKDAIPELNYAWLLIGEGNMFNGEVENIKPESEESEQGIPLIPLDAMAGFGEGGSQIMEYDTNRYLVPEFTELKAEFMIKVSGDSMTPIYRSQDLLACKKIPMSFFQWNKVYVLDTSQGALVKRVKQSDKEGYIQCFSDNEAYAPFDLATSEINAIAMILGVIRLE